MKSINPHGNRFRWINTGATEVPPYGCVKLSATNRDTELGEPRWDAIQPDGDAGTYLVSDGNRVPVGFEGSALTTREKKIAFVDGSYGFGTTIGPVSGQWSMGSGGTGWVYLEELTASYALVLENPEGSSTGGTPTIMFTILESNFCGECSARVRVLSRPTGGELVPEEDAYNNQLVVYDKTFPNSCFLNEPSELLRNRVGFAQYLFADEDGPCPDTVGYRWHIISMCGPDRNGCE